MSLFIILGAFIGLIIRGVTGAFVGAAVGALVATLARSALRRRLRQVQATFIDTTFAVMGALCKADGVVTRDEIEVVEQIFERLRFDSRARAEAKAAFNRGKDPGFDLDGTVARFARLAPRGRVLVQLFLQLQLLAVAADGQLHPAEHSLLVRVARGLGLSALDVARLEALLRAATGSGATSAAVPPKQQLDDAYAALGVRAEASDAELKRAYRKMIRDNHPDRIAAQGLPESMRELAEERARKVNGAYDVLKKARNLS